jgi:acyl-CoA thioester hydrolase
MPYRHQLRVRYGECDRQGVVYNANYMIYVDEATEIWVRSLSPKGDYRELNWEWMAVRSVIEWCGSARDADILTIDTAIVRYGSTSFDFGFIGTVDDRLIFKARSVCVSVASPSLEKTPIPDAVKAMLGAAVDWDVPA